MIVRRVTRNEMVQLSAKLGQYIERSEVESLIKNKAIRRRSSCGCNPRRAQ